MDCIEDLEAVWSGVLESVIFFEEGVSMICDGVLWESV